MDGVRWAAGGFAPQQLHSPGEKLAVSTLLQTMAQSRASKAALGDPTVNVMV